MSVHTVLADHALHDEVLAAGQKRAIHDFKIAHAGSTPALGTNLFNKLQPIIVGT